MLGVRTRRSWSLAAALGLVACVDVRPFACVDSVQCDRAPGGWCVEPGFCAFPDPACPSGYRFDDSATEALSGRCVDREPAGTETGDGTSTTSGSTTGGSDESTLGTTTSSSSGGTTLSLEDSSTSNGAGDGTSSSTGDACGEGPCPCTAAIGVGAFYNCAVRSDGSIVCWGRNNFGQLGTGLDNPPFDDEPTPLGVGGVTFATIAAGSDHGCAGTDDGSVWCWGRNNVAQSAPALGTAFALVAPTSDSGATDSATITVGLQSTCSADAAGVLTCWGSNNFGQLATSGSGPGPLTSGPHVAAALGYSSGLQHACTWDADTVACWGRNNFGQLAQPAEVLELEAPTAVAIDAGAGVVAVATGRHHTCAAVDGGAVVQCWGRNDCGQVDDAGLNCTQADGPNTYAPVEVALPAAVVELRAGQDHTCARTENDFVYCWGGRQGWWLGTVIDNGVTLFPPAQVIVLDEVDEPIVEFGVGSQHACGRAASGRLWCWGSDQYQQLGVNDPERGERTVEMDLLCAR